MTSACYWSAYAGTQAGHRPASAPLHWSSCTVDTIGRARDTDEGDDWDEETRLCYLREVLRAIALGCSSLESEAELV